MMLEVSGVKIRIPTNYRRLIAIYRKVFFTMFIKHKFLVTI